MAPTKAARGGQDDSKADSPVLKEKNGGSAGSQSNGKMRRVASSAGSNLREVTNASATNTAMTAAAAGSTASAQEAGAAGQIDWSECSRETLQDYRRAFRLKTPSSFFNDYHLWALTQPGSIGLYSPTIARRKEFRKQTQDQLAKVVQKHYDSMVVQENDVLVDFLNKVRSQEILKGRRRRPESVHREPQR
ncbi:hypothetical protein VTK56DRAFT_3230 [Thermocarpiscus australiensis]